MRSRYHFRCVKLDAKDAEEIREFWSAPVLAYTLRLCIIETYICSSCHDCTGLRTISEYPALLHHHVACTDVGTFGSCSCTSFMYRVTTFVSPVCAPERLQPTFRVGSVVCGVCAYTLQVYIAVEGDLHRCLCLRESRLGCSAVLVVDLCSCEVQRHGCTVAP